MLMAVPHATTFAVALAELLHLLGSRADAESVRHVFAPLCLIASEGRVELHDDGELLRANGHPVEAPARDIAPLLTAMRRHGVSAMDFDWSAAPEDLLLVASLLAEEDPSVQPLDSRAHASGCWHVVLRMSADLDRKGDPEVTGQFAIVHPAVERALGCSSVGEARGLSEMIVELASDLKRAGDAVQVARILRDMLQAETNCARQRGATYAEIRRVWMSTFDRIATRDAMDLVTLMLPQRGYPEPDVLAVLQRAGDVAAAAMIGRLLAARQLAERRVLYDTIVHVRAGSTVLLRCLQHPEWHVVRNAALLLGAMRSTDVESALGATLKDPDSRVRVAVVTALIEIGTPAALTFVEAAMADLDRSVRHRAIRSLRGRADLSVSVHALANAFEIERDEEFQMELLAGIVRHGTNDAVSKLVRLCSPAQHGRFATPIRLALLEALNTLRPSLALPLLRVASRDRDPAVSERARELAA